MHAIVKRYGDLSSNIDLLQFVRLCEHMHEDYFPLLTPYRVEQIAMRAMVDELPVYEAVTKFSSHQIVQLQHVFDVSSVGCGAWCVVVLVWALCVRVGGATRCVAKRCCGVFSDVWLQ